MSEKDKLLPLKHIGYCWSQMPPDEDNVTYGDFLAHVKFSLCKLSHRLMKDPLWDEYTAEEMIAEYYAHVYTVNKEERALFETTLRGEDPDVHDWLDKMIEDNQEVTKQKIEEMGLEDSLSFKPEGLGDDNG